MPMPERHELSVGQDGDIDRPAPASRKATGRFARGGAGRQHVVDQQDGPACQLSPS